MCKACNLTFSNLHVHNQYSSLDGFGQPDQFVKVVKDYDQKALGVTNHGVVSGNFKFYQECKKGGIKPILGCEIYFEPDFNKEKVQEEKRRGGFSHLTVFAKNRTGFENLNKIITASNLEENFYYKPITDWNILQANRDGLIILSGCILSRVGRYLRAGQIEEAVELIKKFQGEFGSDYFLEVMPPFLYEKGADEEELEFHKFNKEYNRFIIEQGKKLKIPVVMTTDAHFAAKEDWSSYRVMRYMAHKGKEGGKYPDNHYRFRHLMNAETVLAFWNKYMDIPGEEFIENTQLVVDKSNIELDFGDTLPRIDWGESSKDKLIKLAIKGLKQKGLYNEEYKQRLSYELETILGKGFEDYFLLVYRICQRAKELDIAQGFGRGSVCGSVLAFAIGITDVDPILFDITFDRFLRPDKNTIPDVDMDFDSRGQDKILASLLNEFSGRASRIITYGQYKTKNLFNDLVKYYNFTEEEIQESEKVKIVLEHEIEKNKITEYEGLVKNRVIRDFDKKHQGFVKHLCKIHGQIKYTGQHAAGVALTDKPFEVYDAIMQTGKAFVSSQDKDQLDEMNIVKMDILGLSNLAVATDIEKLTGANRYDFLANHLHDSEIYKAFNDKLTTGIFQFDSWSSGKVLQQVKPQNIYELCACNAVNRPGPEIEPYIKGKEKGVDEKSFWYPYTKETYGAIIYQEQLLLICKHAAGLDWPTSDKIVKFSSKKVPEILAELKIPFVEGCVKNGIDRKEASIWYDKNTLYSFNKAHTYAYTLFAAYCMWLKIKYPVQFWFALLKNEEKEENREKYLACAVRSGIIVFPANVNSGPDFELISDNEQLGFELLGPGEMVIREGLTAIKGLGEKTAEWIMSNRPYKSKEQFMELVNNGNKRRCNKRAIEVLEEHGAFDFDLDNYVKRAIDSNAKIAKRFRGSK